MSLNEKNPDWFLLKLLGQHEIISPLQTTVCTASKSPMSFSSVIINNHRIQSEFVLLRFCNNCRRCRGTSQTTLVSFNWWQQVSDSNMSWWTLQFHHNWCLVIASPSWAHAEVVSLSFRDILYSHITTPNCFLWIIVAVVWLKYCNYRVLFKNVAVS